MKNRNNLANIIRWIARIWGSISLAFMLLFVGAYLLEAITGEGLGNHSLSFLFFPVSTMIGLGIAWKWEGIGGLITIAGIIGFHILRPDLIFNFMINGLAAPGLLFIAYWLLSRIIRNKNEAVQ